MKKLLLFTNLILILSFNSSNAQLLETPIEGIYGTDYIIVNYIDWGIDHILDFNRGSKTYKGHSGTDFVISGFPQMDEGVFVNSVDTGIVTFVHDGEFDRNTDGNISLGFGNYIAIRHPNKTYTYYAHLKKNSLLVKKGDYVSPGQHIALVGSSGNSTDPHLHFEMWYDSLFLIEPFANSCGANYSHFKDLIPYDTSFHIWQNGITDFIPPIDSLRNRPAEKYTFNDQDSIISFWALQYGLKTGDSTRIEWITPLGDNWFNYTTVYDKDYWFYYYSSYIFAPPSSIYGQWTYNYYYNDKLVVTGNFEIEKPDLINELNDLAYYKILDNTSLQVFLPDDAFCKYVEVFNSAGKTVLHKKINDKNIFTFKIPKQTSSPQMFFVSVNHSKGNWQFKIVL